MINVVICDDHQLFREGLSLILSGIDDVNIVGEFQDGQEILTWLEKRSADVILMDINMPNIDGINACKIITKKYPLVKVIYLSMINQVEIFQVLLESGAMGFLLKNSSSVEVEAAIKKVYQGEKYFDTNLFNQVNKEVSSKSSNFYPKLTKREKEVLQLIIAEYTSVEIAAELFISQGTVETHRRNLISKLNVKNTAGLVRVALEYKLI